MASNTSNSDAIATSSFVPWSFASRACPAVLAAALIIRIDLVIPGGTFLKKKAGCDLILNAEVSLIGNNEITRPDIGFKISWFLLFEVVERVHTP